MYLASLILGLGAWAVLIWGAVRKQNKLIAGFVLCSAALFLQICQTNVLVNWQDWAAIEDTFLGVQVAATVLLNVAVILAAVNLIRCRKK